MSDDTADITLSFGPVPDPSDPESGATVKPVNLSQETITVESETIITFSFDGETMPEGARFTGFRYFNTGADHESDYGWWSPNESGHMFKDLHISEDGQTMSVTDRATNDLLYFYVVEWEEGDGKKYVCDPKIKNKPVN